MISRQFGVARHEQIADGVFAGLRQREAELASPCVAKNLCGICTRMPAPSPARGSAPTAPRCSRLHRIVQRVLDDLVRLAALDVGDEADAAGILVERRIVEAVRLRHAGIGGIAIEQARVDERGRTGACAMLAAACRAPRSSSSLSRHALRPGAGTPIHVLSTVRRCGPRRTRVEGSLLAGRSPAPRGAAHCQGRWLHAQAH